MVIGQAEDDSERLDHAANARAIKHLLAEPFEQAKPHEPLLLADTVSL